MILHIQIPGNKRIPTERLRMNSRLFSGLCFMAKAIDIVGKRFGRLTALQLHRVDKYPRRYVHFWLCRCVCGIEKVVNKQKLTSGETTSCGCYQREVATKNASTYNGLSKHPLWRIWRGVWNRCYRKTVKGYPLYGGNGVEMCKEWREDFMAFYNWCIANKWEPGLQIDKDIIPKKLGIPAKLYGPKTCCFVTCKVNNNNRTSNVYVEFNGETKTIAQWSEQYGMRQGLVSARLRRGWPLYKALTIDTKLTDKRKC